jgi:hypothetical protein
MSRAAEQLEGYRPAAGTVEASPDCFQAMPDRLSARVRFNAWRDSVTVQVGRPFDPVVVAHLVAQSRDSLTVSVRTLGMAVG